MSQAHRPTWNPTQGRESKAGSQQIAKLSLAAHTKLKFRQPGQTSAGDVARRDLKAELAAREREVADKKRKKAGLPPLPPLPSASGSGLRIEAGNTNGEGAGETAEDEERAKRRKILEEALRADADDSSDEDEGDGDDEGDVGGGRNGGGVDKGKGKAVEGSNGAGGADDDEEEDENEDDDDDSDEEDDTAALMAELAKIKQERAEEKARMDAEAAASTAATRDQEIATGNPLLNLQAALGQTPSTPGTPASSAAGIGSGGFTVKRRWDDDLIFKNQAAGVDDKNKNKGEFVNDLLRSEFHKRFMLKFIK